MKTPELILVKPHDEWFYKDWVKSKIAQKKWKNVAANRHTHVLGAVAKSQHQALVSNLENISSSPVHVFDFPDTREENNGEIAYKTKIEELDNSIQSNDVKRVLNNLLITEAELQEVLTKNIKANKEIENIEDKKPETEEKWMKQWITNIANKQKKLDSDSFVYVRDAFLSNQKDKILISNFQHVWRRHQADMVKWLLEILVDQWLEREIIVHDNKIEAFEWGDFRYLPHENILFAWYSKKWSRNTKEWIEFVKKQFWIEDENYLELSWKNAFHIDTFFSVLTDDQWKLIWGIICNDICSIASYNHAKNFFNKRNLPLLDVPREYWVTKSEWNGKKWEYINTKRWGWIINTLQLNQYLISSDRFPHDIEMQMEKMWVIRRVTPTSEYWKAWGWVHCLTNQL